MRGGSSPDPTDFRTWMRDTNRRLGSLESRPPPARALDLLGPGLDSSATLVSDWNDDTIYFNGMYYSEPGADNAPDNVHRWVGLVIIDQTGSGYQILEAVPTSGAAVGSWTHNRMHRVFDTPEGSTRVYSPWEDIATGGGGGGSFVPLSELVVDVKDYGADPTGATDSLAAILTAITAAPTGATVYFPPGNYTIDAAWTITKSVTLLGSGATLTKGPTVVSGNWLLASASNVRLVNLKVDDSAGKITGNCFVFGSGLSNCRVDRCTINAPKALAIITFASSVNFEATNNNITACKSGIQTLGLATSPRIIGNWIKNWSQRGIYIVGDAAGPTTDLQIVRNRITDMVFGDVSRYPILISLGASATNHQDMLIEGNTLFGPGKSWTDPVTPGTADMIGVFHVDLLRIIGNQSNNGGDMGITVDGNSTNITITGNVCNHNDSGGIAVAGGCARVTITGNVCMNNGQNRQGDRSTSRTGVWANTATDICISGNVFGDSQSTKTQLYGVNMDTCDNVSLGPDINDGVATALYQKNGAANTNIVKVTTAAF